MWRELCGPCCIVSLGRRAVMVGSTAAECNRFLPMGHVRIGCLPVHVVRIGLQTARFRPVNCRFGRESLSRISWRDRNDASHRPMGLLSELVKKRSEWEKSKVSSGCPFFIYHEYQDQVGVAIQGCHSPRHPTIIDPSRLVRL